MLFCQNAVMSALVWLVGVAVGVGVAAVVLLRIRSRSKTPFSHSIALAGDSFTVSSSDGKRLSARWHEVRRIVVFKQDLWIGDRICLVLSFEDQAPMVVHEEMDGWSALVDALPAHLAGCIPFVDWFDRVAFPAFKTNPTEIYRR